MNEKVQDAWQRCRSPLEGCWKCMKQLRAAAIRREIAADTPLYLAPTIAAYLANEHEITRTQIGIVTVPMPTTSIKNQTIIHIHRGETI